jgi:hypothetical protein
MSEVHAAPVKYAGRSYIVECALAMGLYVGLLLARPWAIAHAANHALALAATLAPALPIWLMLLVVWRYYRRIDEYEQKKLLETLAIAFGIGSCLIVTYSFLADAGLPELAITWAWPTLAVSWGLTTAIRSLADHRA